MNTNKRNLLLAILALGAVAAIVAKFVDSPSFDEERYRDIANLMAEEVTWEEVGNGCQVSGMLANRDTRAAMSVVLRVELVGEAGQVIATNPMVNVLDLPPMSRNQFKAFILAENIPSGAEVVVKPVVVRWEE